MNNLFFRISSILRNFFAGRYGIDNYSIALIIFAVLLSNIRYLWALGYVITGYAIFRVLSKDISRRRNELEKFNLYYNKAWHRLQPFMRKIAQGLQSLYYRGRTWQTRYQQRRTHVFIKCPKCHKTLRLPRNKGKLLVTCPVCKNEFYKNV